MDGGKKQTVAIFDLDATITNRDTHVPFYLAFLRENPKKWLRAMPVLLASARFVAGDRDRKKLKEAFLKGFLGGVTYEAAKAFAKGYADYWMTHRVHEGAIVQIQKHREQGDTLILATASYHLWADPMANILKFDHVIATEMELDADGRITGKLKGANCRGEVKRDRVNAFCADRYPSAHRMFYSDDVADQALLEDVDEPFIVNPDPKSRKYGAEKGFPILDWRTA